MKQNNPRQQQQQQQLPTSTKMQTFRCIMHIMKESSILASSCQTFHEALNLGFGKLLKVSPVKSGIIWKVVRIDLLNRETTYKVDLGNLFLLLSKLFRTPGSLATPMHFPLTNNS